MSMYSAILPGTLQYAGNSLSDRKRSLRGGARGIFILQERHLQSGRVTSFYANFAVRDKPVRFQIWRPTTNDRNTLMLVGEHRYVPVTTGKQMVRQSIRTVLSSTLYRVESIPQNISTRVCSAPVELIPFR